MPDLSSCNLLSELWWRGVHAVGGREATHQFLSRNAVGTPTHILAIGKAAEPMYLAAEGVFGGHIPHLVLTKTGHASRLKGDNVIEGEHPTPGENSLRAGQAAMDFVTACGPGDTLLVLLSGGASAIAELPEDGITLADIVERTRALLASGRNIGEVNAARVAASRIKGGKLLSHFKGDAITVLAISDVEGDAIGTIGSGVAAGNLVHRPRYESYIVASNRIAREAIADAALSTDVPVAGNEETLYRDVADAAYAIAATLQGEETGLWIWGGEPTVILPDAPGRGGRNQELALRIAKLIDGHTDTTVFVAGTDGTDGPTDAAGACVTGATWSRGPGGDAALDGADSGSWFDRYGGLVTTGPTGTNVMDIVIALKR